MKLAGSHAPPDADARLRLLALAALFAAAVLWSRNGVLIKYISGEGGPRGVPALTTACYRSLIGGLVLLPLAWPQRRTLRTVAGHWPVLSILAFTVMSGTFVAATAKIAAASAILLQYTSPVWVFLLAPLILKEQIRRHDWLVLAIAMAGLGVVNLDCRQDGAPLGTSGQRGEYVFNSGFIGVEDADAILLIGTNPRHEAPVLNARIRKAWLRNLDLRIGLVGEAADLTFDYAHLGAGPEDLIRAFDMLDGAERPMVVIGIGALARPDGEAVMKAISSLAAAKRVVREGWNGFNVLHTAAARVGALDLGFLPGEGGRGFSEILAGARNRDIDVVYNLGADEFDARDLGGAVVIEQGHHGDAGARSADVSLPGAA